MKHVLWIGILLVAATSLSSAQVGGGVGVHTGISISSFDKPVKDYYGLGFGFGAHGDLNVGKYFTGRLMFDYHMFGVDDKKIVDQIAAANNVPSSDLKMEGWTVNVVAITLNGIGKIPTGSPVTPYALAGLGMHFLSQSDPKLTYQGQDYTNQVFAKPESRTKFGINFGAGSEFSIAKRVVLGLDFRYVLIFSKDEAKQEENNSHMPITVSATYVFN